MVAQQARLVTHDSADFPDEYYLIQAASREMNFFITQLGTGAIDSSTLRRSIRHLLEYGQDSELTALLEYAIVQAIKNVTQPTGRQQLKRNLGKASFLLETRLPIVTKTALTRPKLTKIIALFEQLSRTADLQVQHIFSKRLNESIWRAKPVSCAIGIFDGYWVHRDDPIQIPPRPRAGSSSDIFDGMRCPHPKSLSRYLGEGL